MKNRRSTAALAAARLAPLLALGLAPGLFAAEEKSPVLDPAAPAAASAAPAKLEPFEVTGSRIKRLDYETPAPVVTYSASSIEEKGYSNLGEFMQSLPFNNSTANSEFTTASFITGAATINLRGLGSNRSLTLLNGRRAVPYALTNSASGTPQTVFNFNSIPRAAIDHIDFLKDGASAIYGSDAITGVINIVLKKNYSGSSVDFSLSNTLKHDSLNRTVNAFTGVSKNGWDAMIGLSYSARHSNFLTDFGINSVDYRSLGAKGQSFLGASNNPSYLQLSAAQAVAAGLGTVSGYYVVTGGVPTANPTKASFSYGGTVINLTTYPKANLYDQAKDTQVFPASESSGLYASLSRRLNDSLTVFSSLILSRTNSYYEGVPANFSTSIAGLVFPASNPYNPLGFSLTQSATSSLFSVLNSADRAKREVNDRVLNGLVGVRGRAFKIWEWESALGYGVDRARRLSDQITASELQAVLAGTTRQTAFNLFGPSDNPHVLTDRLVRIAELDNKLDSFTADFRASASAWQIPLRGAGELGVAAGYEYRRETLHGHPEASTFLNYTNRVAFHGDREAHSAFLELSVPLQKWLEFQLAGRREHYSDFGDTTKPKVSAKLKLPANRFVNVLLRGSYSESFKAPDLGQLYQKQTAAISGGAIADPLRPFAVAVQIRSILGGNPDLKPELGKVQYVGGVLEFPAIKNFSVSVDYFDYKIDNIVNSLSTAYLISADGVVNFPNAVIRGPNLPTDPAGVPGPILFVNGISNNLGFQLYQGFDFGLRYSLRQTRLGNFTFSADAVQTVKRGTDTRTGAGFGDVTGRYFAPVWRYNYSLGWSYKSVSASANADIIGKYNNRGFTAVGWGENVYPIVSSTFTYRGPKRTTFTLGMNNVMNNRAPANGFVVLGFDDRSSGSGGALGRSLFLRGRREF